MTVTSFRWEVLDDRSFVGLVADLLRRRGFVDVSIQGEGPDGGLDILATEMVAFSFEGARPLRWGVQCKFSIPTGRHQVTDDEVRDVGGILTADRYRAQELGGYLLVTNRRVAYNVADRLRGLDRQSRFRTSILDGHRLELLLAEEPGITNAYFGRILEEIQRLAEEQARERSAERSGESGLTFEPEADFSTSLRSSFFFDGDLSGHFDSAEGIIELYHDEVTGVVAGQYCWNSDDFVADLKGTYSDGILLYEFVWRRQDIQGSGFHFVAPDGDHLEGLWFLTDLTIEAPLNDILRHGRRKSYWRTR